MEILIAVVIVVVVLINEQMKISKAEKYARQQMAIRRDREQKLKELEENQKMS